MERCYKSFIIISNDNKEIAYKKQRDISKEKGKRVNCGNLVRYGFRYAVLVIYEADWKNNVKIY